MTLSSKLQVWFDAARPKTLPAAIVPVMVGTAIVIADGKFHVGAFLAALVDALLLQIGTNFTNDYYDYLYGADNEKRLGPTRATQAGLIKPDAMKRAFLWTFFLAFCIGFYLSLRAGFIILILGILSILSGFFYTAGPLRLGYRGLGDIFVLIFFGPIAVGGTYYVQALHLNLIPFIAGLTTGLLSTAILVVNNLRDEQTDREAGKKTLVVRYGSLFGKWEYLFCMVGAFLIPLLLVFSLKDHFFCLLVFLIFPASFLAITTIFTQQKESLNPMLGKTGKLLLFYGVLFSIGWLL